MPVTYDITAVPMTIYFNREGDHDRNGLMFALTKNVPILRYLDALAHPEDHNGGWEQYHAAAKARAAELGIEIPPPPGSGPSGNSSRYARAPHPLVRPLVIRANRGTTIDIVLRNEVQRCHVGLHLVGDGYDVRTEDGSHVGANPSSLVAPGQHGTVSWTCAHEGVFPFHDGGHYSGGEDGTNVHGLFGALIVEAERAIWRDPVTGRTSKNDVLDGLYLDVIPSGEEPPTTHASPSTDLSTHDWGRPVAYHDFDTVAHREFVIFFHDEPEFVPAPELAEDPCADDHGCGHGSGHARGHGGGFGKGLVAASVHGRRPCGESPHHDPDAEAVLPIMPVSYRAEPMVNREQILFKLIAEGHKFEHPVLHEEQHHSSWMFGDPATPILKAYIGDPVRIRFVHAGVKETHVFHLHLYEWHAVPKATDVRREINETPRIDAISVSPQTGHTIEPVWGAGNRQQVAGDVIWHCHLYPHFHEGMWGMFRTFETLQLGTTGEAIDGGGAPEYDGRIIGQYPDGTQVERLLPLPKRTLPPRATPRQPGFPLFIPGKNRQKSPIPPWPDRDFAADESPILGLASLRAADMPGDFDYRPSPTPLERAAFNEQPVPGEMFTRCRFRRQQDEEWEKPKFRFNDELGPDGARERWHDVVVAEQQIEYNHHEWCDKQGHLYYLDEEGDPATRVADDGSPRRHEPLFFRAREGQILNLPLSNKTKLVIKGTEFDLPFPPCPERPWAGECALHVHMVKFDPICADGASVGWNYMSGPRVDKRMVYRWWLDQEFGTIFFHDHLFANFRQKHGLFGALIVEPVGARFMHPFADRPILSGLQSRVYTPRSIEEKFTLESGYPGVNWFREFCLAIGDFVPMWKGRGDGTAINPPACPGGHGDQGVMAINYRCEPIPERLRHDGTLVDPSCWFTSTAPYQDPSTTIFETFANEPVWFRIIQGSHEEQHSLQVHGMRWQRFRGGKDRVQRNQQAIGIAEAFTFINHQRYGAGDHLYKLTGADDLWLGCWGLIRAHDPAATRDETGGLLPLSATAAPAESRMIPQGMPVRRFHVRAVQQPIAYRDPDIVDPFGLVYQLVGITGPDGQELPVHPPHDGPEPLVIRCREGEVVELTLENAFSATPIRPERCAPEVPVEGRDSVDDDRPDRPVSSHVSMHADLLDYDVRTSDGANVGRNPPQSVAPGDPRTYTWYAPVDRLRGTIGPVLLQDMADFRNHRHHGLVGALIVEPKDVTPLRVEKGAAAAGRKAAQAWHGPRVTLASPGPKGSTRYQEEIVLLLQDGLRHFVDGDESRPLNDEPPSHGEDDTDPEDQGQKGFNYRSEPLGKLFDPNHDSTIPPRDWLAKVNPATPTFHVPAKREVRLHLVGACDKPRQHSFTIHGVTWPEWHLGGIRDPMVSSESAITGGTARTFVFTPAVPGDYAYRSGVLKWAVPQGLWGLIRVV